MAGPLPISSTLVMSVTAGIGLGIGLVVVKLASDLISEKTGFKIPSYYTKTKKSYVGYDDLSVLPPYEATM